MDGGQQDRCVGQESIIVADGKPVKIEVSAQSTAAGLSRAVRGPGRDQPTGSRARTWTRGENKEESSPRRRRKASSCSSRATWAMQAAPPSRKGKGQGEVWNQVGIANSSSNVQAMTGNFNANYTRRGCYTADRRVRQGNRAAGGQTEPSGRRGRGSGRQGRVGRRVRLDGTVPEGVAQAAQGSGFRRGGRRPSCAEKKAQPAAQASAAKLVTLAETPRSSSAKRCWPT